MTDGEQRNCSNRRSFADSKPRQRQRQQERAHCHHAPAPQQRVNLGVEGRESDLQVGTKVCGVVNEEWVVVVSDLMCVLCALLVLLLAD